MLNKHVGLRLAALASGVLLLTPPIAAGLSYEQGRYSGTVQAGTYGKHPGKIHFLARKGAVAHLKATATLACVQSDASGLAGTEDDTLAVPTSSEISVKRNGQFTFKGDVGAGRFLEVQGRLNNGKAGGQLSAVVEYKLASGATRRCETAGGRYGDSVFLNFTAKR